MTETTNETLAEIVEYAAEQCGAVPWLSATEAIERGLAAVAGGGAQDNTRLGLVLPMEVGPWAAASVALNRAMGSVAGLSGARAADYLARTAALLRRGTVA